MSAISQIKCHKIINSRGDWTIETQVMLDDGALAEQSVPEGASRGRNEAVYVPPDKSVEIVSSAINEVLLGRNPFDQGEIDRILIEMDGTSNKEHLGGNSILSVSLAVSKAAAVSKNLPLYKYLAELYGNKGLGRVFPVPVFNILNGGKHAKSDLSFQEFMIIPAARLSYDKALRMGVHIYHILEAILENDGFDTDVGDEGGFAPEGFTNEKAFEYLKRSAGKNYKVGEEVFFGSDVAANSFRKQRKYQIKEESLDLSTDELINYHENLLNLFEIIYYEDPFFEGDEEGWFRFNSKYSEKMLVVADDLTVTNPKFLKKAINKKLCNAVIVKPNQVGTLSETLEFIKMAKDADMAVNISHRSGDTAEDTFISDLAVAVGADFIKAGAPARGERVVKYNRLLEIFEELIL